MRLSSILAADEAVAAASPIAEVVSYIIAAVEVIAAANPFNDVASHAVPPTENIASEYSSFGSDPSLHHGSNVGLLPSEGA